MYKLIIFDLDGTVLDTVRDIHESLMETLKEYGLPLFGIETTKSYVGDGIAKLVERATTPDKYTKDTEQCFRRIYNKRLTESTKAYPGIIDVLKTLRKEGFTVVFLSNKAYVYTDSIIRHFGLDKVADSWFGSDSFAEKKPSPLPVREIMAMRRAEPSETMIIGDNYTDIESGYGAGIKTCFCKYGYGKLKVVQADYFADTPEDILKIVRQ
jgi:phosphoglycolate phosphatase